jgi:hypothetical protein
VGRDTWVAIDAAAERMVDVRGSMKWFGVGVVGLMVVGFAAPALAQDTPMAEVSVGYNWLGAKQSSDDEWTKLPKGWYADVAGNVSDTLSIVGQVTGNYKTFEDDDELKVHTFMAGLRGSSPGRIRGFGQFLVGGVNLKAIEAGSLEEFTETDLAIQLGGGVNALGSGNVGLRIGVDYLRVFAKEESVLLFEDLNGFRVNVGVTFGIGSR